MIGTTRDLARAGVESPFEVDDANRGACRAARSRGESPAVIEATVLAVRDVVEAWADEHSRGRLVDDGLSALEHVR